MATKKFQDGSKPGKQPVVTVQDMQVTAAVKTAFLTTPGEPAPAGKPTITLALAKPQRDRFFAARPQVKDLLSRQLLSPLTEEGWFEQSADAINLQRDRDGEYFMTAESITLWIQQKFFEDDSCTAKYNRKNIFIINDSGANLRAVLTNLNLQDGEDAKLILIDGIHAYACYIRNDGGMIKAFIVDSQAGMFGNWPKDVIKIIKSCLGNIAITLSSNVMQADTYSCSTFAMQALRFFAKCGADIFPHIEKTRKHYHRQTGCNLLPPECLMPELMKMMQISIPLPESAMNTIVSTSKNLTLDQYLHKYAVMHDGKPWNAVANVKKYKYLDQVNNYIISHTNHAVSPNPHDQLPAPLGRIFMKFQNPDLYQTAVEDAQPKRACRR